MKNVYYEMRYLAAGPFTLLLLVQFAGLFWLDRNVKNARWWFAPLVVVFLIEDFLYQVFVGTFLFLERPRDWLFTGRIARMDERGDPRAVRFKRVLNAIDEGHV